MKKTLIAAIFFTLSITACTKIQEPEFREVRNFRVKSLGLEDVTIGFGMTYFNPNNFSVTVKETGADVYLDSVFLGRFVQDTAVAVGQKVDFTVPLSGSIPLTTFFKLNLNDIHKREVSIRADGSTRVGKAGIFITQKINYHGRHRLNQIKF